MTNPLVRDAFCSYCGMQFPELLAYPRTCANCAMQIFANPIPVCVVLVPIVDGNRTGLLVVRRAIPPAIGKLALPGGFLEEHETWRVGAAREVREETGVAIDAEALEPMWYASSSPRPNRLLLFSVAREMRVEDMAPWVPDTECSERGVVFGPDGLDAELAFSLHVEAARMYFARRGMVGAHGFVAR